jgi:hypothetical protein
MNRKRLYDPRDVDKFVEASKCLSTAARAPRSGGRSSKSTAVGLLEALAAHPAEMPSRHTSMRICSVIRQERSTSQVYSVLFRCDALGGVYEAATARTWHARKSSGGLSTRRRVRLLERSLQAVGFIVPSSVSGAAGAADTARNCPRDRDYRSSNSSYSITGRSNARCTCGATSIASHATYPDQTDT